jgi:hypothetical protein
VNVDSDVRGAVSAASNILEPDGTRNRGIARPLFGRAFRASLTYRF